MARRSVNRYFEGLLAGGVIGVAIGILSAPKRGVEMRQQLTDLYRDLSKAALRSYDELKHEWLESNAANDELSDGGRSLVDNFMGNNSGPVYTAAQKSESRQ